MSSIFEGYNYDIFISYRQKDNKYDGWVTEFVDNLKKELEATFKEEISVYFDINPHDGLLETHDVDESLKEKLKCLVFIPIISRTYCDPKSFAWEHEFKAFVDLASMDQFGMKVKLLNGNVTRRVLPVQIHDLDKDDILLCESVIGGAIRGIEFIYKEPGVNKPLTDGDDDKKNLNNTKYRIQINKVANSIKDIITSLGQGEKKDRDVITEVAESVPVTCRNSKTKLITGSVLVILFIILCILFIPKLFKPAEIPEKSIAVLPFVNLSNDPEQEYFSDGMVDAILDHLFKVGGLKVISRTSTMRYKGSTLPLKEIAGELKVSSVLEGSVQRVGSKVRITIQLIDAKTDNHLWSDIFDGDVSDIFWFQSNIAAAVARELKITLTAGETDLMQSTSPKTSQLAYDFYLRGNDYWARFNATLALDMYSKSIKEDSLFAQAWAKSAYMHLFMYWNMMAQWNDHKLSGIKDLETAKRLNPDLIEVKFVEAIKCYWIDRDYDKSIELLNKLKEISPGMADLYGFCSANMRRQGRIEESVPEYLKAIELDPLNANYIHNLTQTFDLLHQYDKMIEWSKRGLFLIPDYKDFREIIFDASIKKTGDLNFALSESGFKEEDVINSLYYYRRQYDRSIELIKKEKEYAGSQHGYRPPVYRIALSYFLKGDMSLCKIYADSSVALLKEKLNKTPDDDRLYATLGLSYALTGNSGEAIACGKKAVDMKPVALDAYQGPMREAELMEIYVLTGNYELAMEKIEYLLSIPSWLSPGYLKIDPLFDNIQKLPRFRDIINR